MFPNLEGTCQQPVPPSGSRQQMLAVAHPAHRRAYLLLDARGISEDLAR
jgi:ABC-type branched-subunit amino acid transport system ATPase component